MAIYEIEHNLTPDEQKDLFIHSLKRLRDDQVKVAVSRRVIRVEQGNFGDHKFCREGVCELRIDAGLDYGVYYALSGRRVLLCGGDKRMQDVDIARAVDY